MDPVSPSTPYMNSHGLYWRSGLLSEILALLYRIHPQLTMAIKWHLLKPYKPQYGGTDCPILYHWGTHGEHMGNTLGNTWQDISALSRILYGIHKLTILILVLVQCRENARQKQGKEALQTPEALIVGTTYQILTSIPKT